MGTYRRINVDSGRPLEHLAHYSRALRVGDTVLQSGTTAIDTQGNVIGEGDVARQVDAIIDIAEASMGRAGGRLEDVVRSRIYVTDITLADAAARAMGRHFRDARPATTLVAVDRLARPTQLIEIELDAVDGAKDTAQRISLSRAGKEEYGFSHAVRVDERVFIAGPTTSDAGGPQAKTGDLFTQTRETWARIEEAAEQTGATLADIVYGKTFLTDLTQNAEQIRARLAALGEVCPVETLLGVPGVMHSKMVDIEAEAIIGAASTRRDIFTQHQREKAGGCTRAVVVGDRVYVSGCTSTDATGAVHEKDDWAAQYDYCHRNIEWALDQAGVTLDQAGVTLDDVIRRRTFTVLNAQQNRPHGEGPGWFTHSRPVSLGCRISGLYHPDMLVEVDAVAIKGAHEDIEWLKLGEQ